MTYIIRKGDPTSTGGVVTQGHNMLEIMGKPAALEGMIATCPDCTKGEGPIKTVEPREANIENKRIVIQGDYVLCGCPEGSNVVQATQFEATAID